jgi:dihydrofolate reductase
MRKLSVGCLVALDGVISSPERWAMPFFDEECVEYSMEQLADVDLFLLGRVAYQELSARWSGVQGNPYLDRINALPKLVASTTLKDVGWNASLVDGDIATAVAQAKKQPGKNIIKYGVSQLDRTLVEHRLVDEYKIWIMPTWVGDGKRLFEFVDPAKLKLDLLSTHRFRNGVLVLTYAPRYVK